MAMKPNVYIETTIVSYLTAWPSRDIVRAAQQQTTHEWWATRRDQFEVLSSELVIIECSAGDPTAASERLKLLNALPALLAVTEAATELADALVSAGAIPTVASRDALHVGICASSGVNYLLTWNFRHLANAQMQDRIREVCESGGYAAPTICAPDALF